MMQTVRLRERIKFIAERAVKCVVRDEKFFQFRKRGIRRERGDGINFHSVARRKYGGLAGNARSAQGRERMRNGLAGKGETFAQFDRRRAVAQSDDNDAH